MTKKHILLALVGMLFVLALSACAPVAPATDAPTEEATEAAGPFEPTTLEAECVEGGSKINKIEATGEHEVTFTLCQPDPDFLQRIAFASFGIQSSEWLEETGGGGEELLSHPVGTGPYAVSEWTRGESLTFTRYADYWGEPAASETLVFRWSAEAAQRLLELQSGNAHGIDNVGPEDMETVEGDSELQLHLRPALTIFYVAFTPAEGTPFADVNVRQAIAMGIDKQRIVDTFYPPGSTVSDYFTPCSVPNGCVGEPFAQFDPEAGRALLAEAGYEDGFETNLYYRDVVRSYLPQVPQVAQDIQAQLAENLNITVNITPMESGEFIGAATSGELTDGIHLLGWQGDYPAVTNFLNYHFNADNPQFGAPHPEIYEPLAEGEQIPDIAEAEPFYAEANTQLAALVPMIPIASGGSAVAYRADVDGGYVSPLANEQFNIVTPGEGDTFVWMQNAEPISLYCADESDGESLRACLQVTETLLDYEPAGTDIVPELATGCESNAELTVWTCTLREGVTFHDGTTFDANDVVFNFGVFLDASNPLHVGNTGAFDYPSYFFGLMNVPPAEE